MTPEFCTKVSERLNELLADKRNASTTKWSGVTGDIVFHPDGQITADRRNIDLLFHAEGEQAILKIAIAEARGEDADVDESVLDDFLRNAVIKGAK